MAYPSVTYTFTNGTTASATEVNQNFTDLVNGLSDGTKDLSISALTVAGTATLNGAVNLGNATSDDIAVNGYITTAIIPKADDSYDLGTAALAWQDAYFDGKVYTDSIGELGSGANVSCSDRFLVDDVTDATTTTDGALQTDGGLSVAKKIYVGEDVNARSVTGRSQSWSPSAGGATNPYDTNGFSTIIVSSPLNDVHTLHGVISSGFAAGKRVLFVVIGTGSSSIVIVNESGSAAAAEKITTGTGGNVTITTDGCFELVFTGTRWWLANYVA